LAKGLQKSWLIAAKRTLNKTRPGLTWDDFAKLAGIEPRAFKTYRMPEDSSDYRPMPSLARASINNLLTKESEAFSSPVSAEHVHKSDEDLGLIIIPALAALVVRQAQLSLIDGRMVAGVDRAYGLPVGLSQEDRRAMSLVSRACLVQGKPDCAAEIHDLLALCCKPLEEWLSIPEVLDNGFGRVTFIHAEDGVPTPEAEELASGFDGVTVSLEEQLFAKFMEILGRYPKTTANEYYTATREFVVRHPVCNQDNMKSLTELLPSPLWVVIQQQFYESVPESWEINDSVPLCSHCGNAMRKGKAGLICRTNACNSAYSASTSQSVLSSSLMRASRGIRQYWIEPGLDEIKLFDAIRAGGLAAELYPNSDRVDIAVGKVGIDLKAYASPETLGWKFKRNVGGLIYYTERWVVIPDWILQTAPSYLSRLRTAAARPELRFLSVSEALSHLIEGTSIA
jgi:hypothetical protein